MFRLPIVPFVVNPTLINPGLLRVAQIVAIA